MGLGVRGKGVYLWNTVRLGRPEEVADDLAAAGTRIACLKVHDGGRVWAGLEPYADALRGRGIAVGAWGYVYLKWNPLAEAKAALEAIRAYRPDFYLIDAEAEAQGQFAAALLFASRLRAGTEIPLGLNSYWKPSYHPLLPWWQLRRVCDFDAPQVYWRGYGPALKLSASKAEYARLKPALPFALPAGDMYLDRGLKPTPGQVAEFLAACRADPDVRGCLMWSYDQKRTVPELWEAYARFDWEAEAPAPEPEETPLYAAAVTAGRGLRVRSGPGTGYAQVSALRCGERVEVWAEQGGWLALDRGRASWSASAYLRRL